MIHSSKTAYVAITDHRDASGAFKAGDIVIVDEPALIDLLVREGSIDPDVVVTASVFTPGAPIALPSTVTGDAADAAPSDDGPAADAAPDIATGDNVTAPASTGHRPATHRMQTASRAKARRS